MNKENEKRVWDERAEEYAEKTFSLTNSMYRRIQLMDRLEGENLLNVGAGSLTYLSQDLISEGYRITAADFSKKMLKEAKKHFQHPRLEYVLADTRNLPFSDETFDSVLSVNSILPSARKDVQKMFDEIYRVLKPNGVFVAFLPSYDSNVELNSRYGFNKDRLDNKELRVLEPEGWQCFHTFDSITTELGQAGFDSLYLEEVKLNIPSEIKQMERIYGFRFDNPYVSEYLVKAIKY